MSDELNEVVDQPEVGLTQADLDRIDEEASTQEAAPAKTDGEETESESDEHEDKPKKLTGEAKRIATLTARNHELREKYEEAQRQLAAAAKPAVEAAEKEPVIPEMPDEDLRFDDPAEWRKQLNAREEAIAERAAWKAEQRLNQREQSIAQQNQLREAQSQRTAIVNTYIENGVQAGIPEERMLENEKALKSVGLNQDIAHYLYSDEAGARLVDYLAANPDELEDLNALHPTQAAVKIATEIKPRALAKKPHATQAPDPATPSRGTARRETEWDNVAPGATFE